MSLACCKVLLCLYALTWIILPQSINGARNDKRCNDLLRRLLRNPPNNAKIAINIGLSKARYICHEGFNLLGKEVRTCRRGKWRENVEPKCLKPCGKPENIPHSKAFGSSFNFNDQLRYACTKGYTLTGPRLRTCGDDGKWSEAPRCEEVIPCGQSLVNARAKIVGGSVSQRGMWPWQIAIYRINKNVPQFACGGVLVSRRWVLTAAHCFYDTWGLFIGNENLYLIKAGDYNLSVNETLQQEVVPKKIFVHPQFKPSGLPFYDGDIALVKLSQDVELSKFVRTVCLPEKIQGDLAIPKTIGTVAGWGVTRPLRRGEFAHLSEISKVLRHISFPIQSGQLCINKSGIQINTTTAFCAGDGRGGEDACQGDSGGGFVREMTNSKWVVVGVVSWGNGCAQKDQYGYYTRVHPFLDWINETMNEKKEPENNNPKNQCSSDTVRQQRRQGINLNEDCGLDLVFLFDASVTVNKFHFQTSLEFAKELLTIIGASKRSARTQVAAVTETKLEFNLGDNKVDSIDKAIKAINNIMYVGWVSSYIRPFKLVRNKVAPNVRNDSHQVMMFITDGLDLSGSVRREARNLRDNKQFDVYAIGIGRRVKIRALMSIASANEDHDHVISVRKYRNLREAVQRVVQMDIVLASCQSPGDIAHGKKFGSDYSHNKTVRYECDAEYTLEGKNRLTCNDGKWNYNPPQCKAPCYDPGRPYQGTRIGDDFRHDKTVTFTCPRDYRMEGVRTIRCSDGQWNKRKPSCKAPCVKLPSPAHGRRSGEGFRHGASVSFFCRYGHTRVGASPITCNDGTWDNPAPVCKGICPQPRIPNKGRLLGNKARFVDGDEVIYFCDSNHDLFGKDRIRCVGKNWDSSAPVCKARCSFSRRPGGGLYVEGRIKKNGMIKHGESITYSCLPDYTMFGSKTKRCDNGRWTSDAPVCKASCGKPRTPVNGNMQGDDFTHNSWVTFTCNQNHQLDGNNNMQCNNGFWSGSVPNCVAVCPDPGVPSKGKRLDNNFQEGKTVTFKCIKDHDLVGNDTIQCKGGIWSGEVPKCRAPCPDPGLPYQGIRIDNDFHHDKTVTFTCPRDYLMEGVRTIRCLDGQWSERKPSCKAPCEKIHAPANGRRLGEGFRHGASLRFNCRYGYTKVGASPITCNDGTWNKPAPVCKGICPQPRIPNKGRLLENKARFLDGDEVIYSCDINHDLFGKDRIRCVGKNWDSSAPVCNARCSFSRRPAGGLYVEGRIKKNGMIKHGESITYGCLPNFTMFGSKTKRCGNGRWTSDAPVCKAPCQSPGGIAQGKKIGDDFRHGKAVSYQCDADYTLEGNVRLTCEDGRWDLKPPECKAVCRDPGVPSKGKRLHDNFQEGKTVTFQCNRDHDLVGNDTIKCEGGIWSDEVPKCRARCAFDGNPDNGYTTDRIFRIGELLPHGSSVKYACDVSYTLVGSIVRHCNDGSWGTSPPSCKAPCDNPGFMIQGRKDGNDYSHGQIVTYECTTKGYTLVGNSQLICNDGRWDSEKPECKAVNCGPLDKPDHGDIIEQLALTFGNRIVFDCIDKGYEMKGSKTRTCQSDGTWSGSPTTCESK